MAPHLLLLLLLAVLGLRCPQGSDAAADCCLTISSKHIPPRIVTSYRIQTPESGCRLRAIVFITKQGLKLSRKGGPSPRSRSGCKRMLPPAPRS
ncbi:hypothetical protein Y1Q_0005150 [Alligator mississippiensis]|uniref:Chemokine interleukin-8-like domain-containing protein n=1 Tax=Alligator mississippiensis TaxID=8496 RepID=A0A151N8H2_ALLMI|nr:hypothetical protein Y1Q_0005150 [Alligator mississippiensis]